MEELEIIKASDISCREIEWLWYPFIPYGKVTILQGDSGDGKSLMVLTLAAMLTRGEPMPFSSSIIRTNSRVRRPSTAAPDRWMSLQLPEAPCW